ncbi:MAG: Hsp70 family protein [Spirochaetaceae bacterium]|jgi:hypothetical protein|nr:Hsp70 family protein [Spirochaetaceae bacterium]
MSSMIGIKIANGAFFPILEENKVAKKRLVLTTAHDAQTNVQIDIYKTSSMSMANAAYVGTLIVENIARKKEGSPSIELVVSYNENGELLAEARDLDNPDKKNKNLMIASMPPDEGVPNFEDFLFEHEDISGNKSAAAVKRPNFVRFATTALVAVLLAVFALWFFVFRAKQELYVPPSQNIAETPPAETVEDVPEVTAVIPAVPPVAVAPPAAPPVEEPRQTPPPSSLRRSNAPVFSVKFPAVIPAGGIKYRLRWGDTLWDVSQAAYRNPWYYRYIARYNGIRNPDRVISGRIITVPPPPR